MSTRRKEQVSASFHYLLRQKRQENGEFVDIKFSKSEFDQLVQKVDGMPTCNLNDKGTVDRLKYGQDIPLERMSRINDRTIFGVFKAPYSGHSYDNSARGKIPADSVSLRQFHYLIYLSKSGKIFLSAQYLGQFGGYTPLAKTITNLLPEPETIRSHTFRLNSSHFKDAKAKKVSVSFARRPNIISSGNVFSRGGMIAIEKQSKDDGFEKDVSNTLLSMLGQPKDKIKSQVAKLLNKNEIFEISDEDIKNCTILADVNGRRKTIYLIEDGSFATKFPLDVPLNADGHPDYEKAKAAMIKLLENEILVLSENV